MLTLAAAAEARQTHPIAKAITQAAHDRQLSLPLIDEAHYEMGYGIKVLIAEQTIHVGKAVFYGSRWHSGGWRGSCPASIGP